MVIFKHEKEIKEYLNKASEKIGFIPTMGALHRGHTSLIHQAKNDGLMTVCSIFVNPTQFNDPEDFKKYPVSLEADIELLLEAECDVLFLPDVSTVYPQGTEATLTYDFGALENILEGAHRPGHFRGVGQVVARLINLVGPDFLYLGQKDFQQCMIIGKLIELMGKENKIKLRVCPTVREADGLAMSSRNRRLSESQRSLSATIYQCLVSIESKAENATFSLAQKECVELLEKKGFRPEYVALADADTLEGLSDYDASRKMVALIAAWIGKIRLIDNMVLHQA
ncbi:MAG: pantoate--beta-alanine ligase [Chitinophagaceae bacterium]